MKLKTFNPDNTPTNRNTKPFISINTKSGTININGSAATLLSIDENSRILFHQSEDNEQDWYLQVVANKKTPAFQLRKATNQVSLIMNNATLVRTIVNSVGYNGTTGRMYIGETVTVGIITLYTLITAGLRNE